MLPQLLTMHGKDTRIAIGNPGSGVRQASDGILLDGKDHGLNATKNGVKTAGATGVSNMIVTSKKIIVIMIGMMTLIHPRIHSMHHHPRVIPPELC